ncbi:Uma2 family endonuclease [Okeania sp. SIO2B3]|uniref:Uma2 family endonuclease n=1 Tax=Okeania sp. SIO2B3 TaxID=2607784 RepID=UPI0013C0AFF4|nr:Uma2 family endonuclease [Okeania sp. SIO2B3]NET41259.1 Uma2 family endonuclease [Okeania sp. SIO2B3]
MVAIPKPVPMTPQEYLDWEEKQPIKYEYMNGQVFAMTGGTIPHNDISLNLAAALKNHLRGKGCKVSIADVKLGVSEKGPFYYPDVMVTCDQRDRRATKVIYHPCLVVEVLSPGTEAFNRGKKFKNYRDISTLKEYVLIDAREMTVECFRPNENGVWELYNYGEGDEVTLTSVDFSFPIEMLYEDVVLEEVEEE